MSDVTATYSPEDRKLRIYNMGWLDDDDYKKMTDAGFRSAPKQELFFASWSPDREDYAIELAGEIGPEDITVAERAEQRAARFDGYSANRLKDANAFEGAANSLSQRFAGGQPILIGHHSEKRARKDQERMNSAMANAVKALDTSDYWNYRATGVERHANRNSNPGVRGRRIKEQLSKMRGHQRSINEAYAGLARWNKIDKGSYSDEVIKHAAGNARIYNVEFKGEKVELWRAMDSGIMTSQECIDICIQCFTWRVQNPFYSRWVHHLLNQLSYERGELGEVARFEGELTPVILQTFAREQGADKPKAKSTSIGFSLGSIVPFPLQVDPTSDMVGGGHLELPEDAWRDLMQSCGHTVIVKEKRVGKKQACPLINPTMEEAEKLQAIWNKTASEGEYSSPSETAAMCQKEYSARSQGDYGSCETISLDAEGNEISQRYHRKERGVGVCRVRVQHGGKMYAANRVVVITDKPQKVLPL